MQGPDVGNLTVNSFALYMALLSIVAFIVVLALTLRAGKGYSDEDAEAHASEFGHTIKESHGGLPALLWVLYAFMLVWAVYYFVQHASEWAIIFAQGRAWIYRSYRHCL